MELPVSVESRTSTPPRGDEVTPIAQYMVREMATNAQSIHAHWTWQVREDGPWDHKPYIRTHFKPANPSGREQNYHHFKGWLYFYPSRILRGSRASR